MTNGNEPAFALEKSRAEQSTPDPTYGRGLTKREYFAAMAMQGLLANYMANSDYTNGSYPCVSEKAVEAADALIAALNTTKQQDNG